MSQARRRSAPGQEPPTWGAAAEDAAPDQESVARAIALRMLTGAPRSRAQLAEKMASKNVPEDVATKVLDRFTEVGLVDDAAYAEMLVRTRHNERGLARRALAQELRRKGVDTETANAALDAVQPEDEADRAVELVRKKARSTTGVDPVKRRRRLVSMLARKGYGPGVAMRAVDQVLGEEDEDQAYDWAADGDGID